MTEQLRDLASGRVEPKRGRIAAWFAGRGRRREYWLLVVPTFIALAVVALMGMNTLTLLVGLGFLFAFIRRLHDLGRSGWWAPVINIGCNVVAKIAAAVGGETGALVGALPFLAALIVLGILPGQAGPNAYGPRPGHKPLADAFT